MEKCSGRRKVWKISYLMLSVTLLLAGCGQADAPEESGENCGEQETTVSGEAAALPEPIKEEEAEEEQDVEDREEILQYVKKEPEMNLFLIGDLENYGVESETVNFYLHEERDRWDFLVLRFHHFYILYSQYEDYNAEEAIAFLKKQQKVDCISGKTVLLKRIAQAFPQWFRRCVWIASGEEKSICACFMTTRRLGGYTTGSVLKSLANTGCCGDLGRMRLTA